MNYFDKAKKFFDQTYEYLYLSNPVRFDIVNWLFIATLFIWARSQISTSENLFVILFFYLVMATLILIPYHFYAINRKKKDKRIQTDQLSKDIAIYKTQMRKDWIILNVGMLYVFYNLI